MSVLYCSICGRAVNPTIHFKDYYVVDYYIEVTGETESVTITSDEQDKSDETYLKLVSHKEIIRCVDCMKKK
jgi:hypothetical protein